MNLRFTNSWMKIVRELVTRGLRQRASCQLALQNLLFSEN
jgi:hypothetical protein